jgi:hypothetical protein
MTDPLFAALPGPAGPLRRLLDARLRDEPDADPVLALVVRSLADRIDWAIGGRQFRAAYRDLLPQVAADDTFEQLLAEIAADAADAGPAVPGA